MGSFPLPPRRSTRLPRPNPRHSAKERFLHPANYRIGTLAVVTLVALRLAVGWHFYQEGAAKLRDESFSSTGFLSSAKGPLAPVYQGMIWDADGYHRLNQADTLEAWEAFRDNSAARHNFDDAQTKQAAATYRRYAAQLAWYLKTHKDDIEDYFNDLDRRERYRGRSEEITREQRRANRAWTEVPSLKGQLGSIEASLKKKRDGWLRTIDGMWANYEHDINAIAATEEGPPARYVSLPRTGRRLVDSIAVDRLIPYFDLTVGILLMLGLFTRVASCAGAAFLATVILTQWPFAADAAPTYYQTIEMLSLLVLAATAAGRFAGLDYLIHVAKLKCCPSKQES